MATTERRMSAIEQMRERRRAFGDGSLAGRARVSTPRPYRSGGTLSYGEGETPPVGIADGAVVPATITVEATDVPVDGEPIEFTDVVDEAVKRQRLVPWSGPADEIVWPHAGTVQCYVEGVLDEAVEAGLVEVLLDDEVVWSSSTPDYEEGS